MTRNELFALVHHICESTFRPMVPYDTGNLHNAVNCEQISPTETRIKIPATQGSVDVGAAHYLVYTDKPWLSPK